MRASLCLKKTEQEIQGNTSHLLRAKHKESTSNPTTLVSTAFLAFKCSFADT